MLRSFPCLLLFFAVGCQCTTAPSIVGDTNPPDTQVEDSEGLPEDTAPERYHPDDYADAAVHGAEARLQAQACVSCHGEDLMGQGKASSCDPCHAGGWREDCLYCHGSVEDGTGAPPLHISGADDGDAASFIPHLTHVQDTTTHAAYGCEQCHAVPADAMSGGHLFLGDDTPAVSEVDFSGGIDSTVGWDGAGSCVSSWCHGDGQGAVGRADHTDEVEGCGVCHEGPESGTGGWERMTGEHRLHLDSGLECRHCHAEVVGEGAAILDINAHVDGAVDVAVSDSWVSWDGSTCDGLCHTDGHWFWHGSDAWD
jgi:hypothetical protein